ncbi:acyl carrier protein [Aeromonas piscicola]|uniref:acyl carrier protein n=1 Tax=Aeromonas piscicola TaxID=600645 RepID=UPI0028E41DBF|nr:acyl carrier protein [Aeromonas piscicola]
MNKLIIEVFHEALEMRGADLTVNTIDDNTVLLESGLDSLGFAILVTLLEERLGFDPFTMMADPIYPTTFGEFVKVYNSVNVDKK